MKDLAPPESVTEHLLRYKPQIEAALSYADNSYSFDQIVAGVLTGRLHFYPLGSAFLITEIQKYPNWSAYHIFLAGGDFKEIIAFQPDMLENAKALGCAKLTMTGRRGFERRLTPHGWDATHVRMSIST